eukprot:s1324_g15.t1
MAYGHFAPLDRRPPNAAANAAQCAARDLAMCLDQPPGTTVLLPKALNIAGRDFVSARILREFKTKSRARLVQMELREPGRVLFVVKFENLSQEYAVMAALRYVNRCWRKNHLCVGQEPVQAITFGIFPLSSTLGFVEVISESRTLRELSEGVPFNERQWRVLRALNQDARKLDRLAASVCAYLTSSYVLGIRDGHDDNLMLRRDGKLFRVDFGFAFGRTPEIDAPGLFVPNAVFLALGEARWRQVVASCGAALRVLGTDRDKPPGWECLVKVPELKCLLPEVHDYTKSLSYSSFEDQVERACDWTLQRAAKNTLREALRYVTAEQEALPCAVSPAGSRAAAAGAAAVAAPAAAVPQECNRSFETLQNSLDHPNIVSYRDNFFMGDTLVIIMQYCEGGDLATYIKDMRKQRQRIDEQQIMHYFVQILQALQYIHSKRILHRDLKTSNLFLMKSKFVVKLGDFGISRVLEGSIEAAITVVGTPYYMSPEVCENKPYTFKSDVWSLGCCLYEMCMLKHAFSADNLLGLVYKIVSDKYEPIPEQYTAQLNTLIQRMLEKKDKPRPSVKELIDDPYVQSFLDEYLQSRQSAARSSRPSPASGSPVSPPPAVSSPASTPGPPPAPAGSPVSPGPPRSTGGSMNGTPWVNQLPVETQHVRPGHKHVRHSRAVETPKEAAARRKREAADREAERHKAAAKESMHNKTVARQMREAEFQTTLAGRMGPASTATHLPSVTQGGFSCHMASSPSHDDDRPEDFDAPVEEIEESDYSEEYEDDFDQYTEDEDQTVTSDIEEVYMKPGAGALSMVREEEDVSRVMSNYGQLLADRAAGAAQSDVARSAAASPSPSPTMQPRRTGSLDRSPVGSAPEVVVGALRIIQGTCMSTNTDQDQEEVQLAIEFSGLQITVKGSPARAAEFVRRVSETRPGLAQHSASSEAPPASVAAQSETSVASSTRSSVRASFRPCPLHWISAAGSNLRASASRLSPSQRAIRAWTAGQWARAVIDRQVATPNSCENIELGNRFWVVLRCENCQVPRIFTSSGSFWAAIGQLEGSDTVTHAFPSETEAKIYADSAGFSITEYN